MARVFRGLMWEASAKDATGLQTQYPTGAGQRVRRFPGTASPRPVGTATEIGNTLYGKTE